MDRPSQQRCARQQATPAWARILGALLALSAIQPAGAAHGGRTNWREMSGGGFQIFSEQRDAKTFEIARQLQAFDFVVGKLQASREMLPDVPALVYVFDHSDFVRYGSTQSGLAGEFFGRAFYNVITIDGDRPFDEVKQIVFHEYTHHVLRNTNAGRIPPWFNEGYAEVYSGFKLKGREVTLGDAPLNIRFGTRDWIPVAHILEVKDDDADYRNERLATQFYAESWALVHWLLVDDVANARDTGQYLANMDVGLPEPEAFTSSFASDKATLDKSLRTFIDRRMIHILRLTLGQDLDIKQQPMAAMTPAQADAALMRLDLYIGLEQRAHELADAALKDHPDDVPLRALDARIRARDAQPVDIVDLKSPFLHGGTGDAQVRIDLADEIAARGQGINDARQIAALLDDLVRSSSPPLEAVNAWARAADETGVPPAIRIPLLEKASGRASHNTALLSELARAQWQGDHHAAARELYNRIILVSWSPEERLWAQKLADSPALQIPEPAVDSASR